MSTLRNIAFTLAIATPLAVLAGAPLKGHPNLQAARAEVDLAWEKMSTAQRANEFDMDGHAEKAKNALRIAVDELKLAAEAANRHDK